MLKYLRVNKKNFLKEGLMQVIPLVIISIVFEIQDYKTLVLVSSLIFHIEF